MTGLVRKASLLAVLGLLATAAVAGASAPDYAHCYLPDPPFTDLVAFDALGTPYPGCPVTISVNDANGLPVANALVTITFNDDVGIYSVQAAGVTVDGRSVSVLSDINGLATFPAIAGAGQNDGTATYDGFEAATVLIGEGATQFELGKLSVTVYDQNGALGLATAGTLATQVIDGIDLYLWGGDYLSGEYRARSDYNHNSAVDGVDLYMWGVVYLANYTYDNGTLQ